MIKCMIFLHPKIKPLLALVSLGACGVFAISTIGQAPAGPMAQGATPAPASGASATNNAKGAQMPEVTRTRNLGGSWKLNTDESAERRDREHEGRGGNGGGRSGGGWPGGGRGGYGGGHRDGMSDDARKEMQELIRPSETLEFTQDGTAIVMTDDLNRHRTFYTDGRKVKKSKDPNSQEFDATW